MAETLEDFKHLLKEFSSLSKWAAAASVAVPFAASMLSVSPPWPQAISPLTSIVELLAIVVCFQFFRSASRSRINKLIISGLLLLLLFGIAYLVGYSQFVYETPRTHTRAVKGFVCTDDVRKVYPDRCPNLGMDELNTVEYEAERLWTLPSITTVRIALVLSWLCAFLSLSSVIAVFLLYEVKRKRNTRQQPMAFRAAG